MDLDKLSKSIDTLLTKLRDTENQVDYLRQRETNLVVNNKNLQGQIQQAQTKIEQILSRLKAATEQS